MNTSEFLFSLISSSSLVFVEYEDETNVLKYSIDTERLMQVWSEDHILVIEWYTTYHIYEYQVIKYIQCDLSDPVCTVSPERETECILLFYNYIKTEICIHVNISAVF